MNKGLLSCPKGPAKSEPENISVIYQHSKAPLVAQC